MFFRFCFSFLLATLAINANNLHITNSVPFGASSLKIVFNQNIENLKLDPVKISQNAVYIDIKAVLDNGKKVYFFPKNAQVTIAQNTPQVTRIVIDSGNVFSYKTSLTQNNFYLSFVDKIPDSRSQTNKAQPVAKPTTTKPPQRVESKTPAPKLAQNQQIKQPEPKPKPPQRVESLPNVEISNNARSFIKKSKFKVVIDAGHGGKDCGALSDAKVCEKTIVLKVAQALDRELKKRGYITFMTRDSDVYLNLKERTDFANLKNADLFVSIHANSVPKTSKKTAKGVETYFLSAARSDRARDVAEQENKDDIEIMNFFSKQTFLNSLNSKRLLASNRLAIDIQRETIKWLKTDYQGIVDGGVREGPFWVLAGALMPSVLVEIGYNSNPQESARLNNARYQGFLAVGIANGIDGFIAKNYK